MLDGFLPNNKCAIYLNHTGGIHYDVVLDVKLDVSAKIANMTDKHGSVQQAQNPNNTFKGITYSQSLKRKTTTQVNFLAKKTKCFDNSHDLQDSQNLIDDISFLANKNIKCKLVNIYHHFSRMLCF